MVEQKNLFKANRLAYRRANPHARVRWAMNKAVNVVRISLAGIFFWFGVLELTGVSPVVELLRHTIPVLAEYPYVQLLGMAQVLIALGLVIDKLSRTASALMMLNLICIVVSVVPVPALIFSQGYTGVTAKGAYLSYYIVFILAGLLILSRRQRQASSARCQVSGVRY